MYSELTRRMLLIVVARFRIGRNVGRRLFTGTGVPRSGERPFGVRPFGTLVLLVAVRYAGHRRRDVCKFFFKLIQDWITGWRNLAALIVASVLRISLSFV